MKSIKKRHERFVTLLMALLCSIHHDVLHHQEIAPMCKKHTSAIVEHIHENLRYITGQAKLPTYTTDIKYCDKRREKIIIYLQT